MLKRVCDKCGQDNNVETYSLPIFKDVEAKGGPGNAKLFSWPALRKEDIDLCDNCKVHLANIINAYMESK